jgi:biotin carboxyl carrier protein
VSIEQLKSPVTGVVWKTTAEVGAALEEGATVLLIESMKMEIPVDMPRKGRLVELLVKEGDAISEGQTVAEIE